VLHFYKFIPSGDLKPANSNEAPLPGRRALEPGGNHAKSSRIEAILAPGILAISGLVIAALAFAQDAAWFDAQTGSLFAALALVASAVALLWSRRGQRQEDIQGSILQYLAGRLEGGIESLKDLHWELRESETRYRDLLDHQGDIIVRRDDARRLTFVNDAFCRAFGMNHRDVIGRVFEPVVLEGMSEEEVQALPLDDTPRCYEQSIETAVGPRWFAWEEFLVRDEKDRIKEIQCVANPGSWRP
jgi:PAS domain S-box-containing protein